MIAARPPLLNLVLRQVKEEMAGWDELLNVLPERLPGCMSRESVLDLVVPPAFATNETVIDERQYP